MSDDFQKAGAPDSSDAPVSCVMRVVLCTFPDAEKAREVASEIVSEELAACVNLIPQVESIYRWEGEIQRDTEVLAIFKVASERYDELERAILAKHPYDTPEIVGISADRVEKNYLLWVLAGG